EDGAYVAAEAQRLRLAYAQAQASLPVGVGLRVLFSAHGLPQSIVDAGDPYAWQIERTAQAMLAAWGGTAIDWQICYQSRATPQKWLEPSTEQAIEKAARDRVAVLVVPIAFVSDHSETLVELDVEYRDLAVKHGVVGYFRAPVANDDPSFIQALAGLAQQALRRGPGLCSHRGGAICPADRRDCPHHRAERAA
ncbi:MAG: ferrochelatase, partial [Rhodospirillales bacterium]|nr:ferrochelatase [Rhodospirillales bacterium]